MVIYRTLKNPEDRGDGIWVVSCIVGDDDASDMWPENIFFELEEHARKFHADVNGQFEPLYINTGEPNSE